MIETDKQKIIEEVLEELDSNYLKSNKYKGQKPSNHKNVHQAISLTLDKAEQHYEKEKQECIWCKHSLNRHVNEKTRLRCHGLEVAGFQCECRITFENHNRED